MEISLGKCLGSGGTAIVYEWGENEVIKIFKEQISEEVIKNEEYIGKILRKYPLPIARYNSTIELNGKIALIYERVDGRAMGEVLLEKNNRFDGTDLFANIHYEIHKLQIIELPSLHEMLERRIFSLKNILGDYLKKIQNLLESIPIGKNLCHGDFQPMNLIIQGDKYSVIDWNGSCSGNPILDVAWTYLTLNSPAIEHMFGKDVADYITFFADGYLTSYCNYSNLNKNNILQCIPIVAVRRLSDSIYNETEVSKYEDSWLKKIIFSLN